MTNKALLSRGPFIGNTDLGDLDPSFYNGDTDAMLAAIRSRRPGTSIYLTYMCTENKQRNHFQDSNISDLNELVSRYDISYTGIEYQMLADIINSMNVDTNVRIAFIPQTIGPSKAVPFEFSEVHLWRLLADQIRTGVPNRILFSGHLTAFEYMTGDANSCHIVSKGYYDVDCRSYNDHPPMFIFDIHKSFNRTSTVGGSLTVSVHVTECNMNYMVQSGKIFRHLYDHDFTTQADRDLVWYMGNTTTNNETYISYNPSL